MFIDSKAAAGLFGRSSLPVNSGRLDRIIKTLKRALKINCQSHGVLQHMDGKHTTGKMLEVEELLGMDGRDNQALAEDFAAICIIPSLFCRISLRSGHASSARIRSRVRTRCDRL